MKKRWMLKLIMILFSVFLVFSTLPYLFPVTKASPDMIPLFPESAFTKIDGTILHYRMWKNNGTGDYKGKVLLVHGLGGSTFSWRNNTDALTQAGYFVLAVDLPGFGYSDRRRGIDHSQKNRSDLLWVLLEQIDNTQEAKIKNDTWNLVGHSMGAGTITFMALENPSRTKSLVFADGAVLAGGNSLGFLSKYPPVGRWIEVLGRKFLLKRSKVVDFLASAYGTAPSDAAVEGYLQPLLLNGTEGSFVDMMRTSTVIKESAFKSLEVPVAAIWGEQDSWVKLESAYQLKSILPEMSLDVIPGAGHCAMETHSVLFNRYLLQALENATE
ncbi:MAG: alpha/beta fold hydrolase [Saccharofermentanales bacterium]